MTKRSQFEKQKRQPNKYFLALYRNLFSKSSQKKVSSSHFLNSVPFEIKIQS